MRRWLGVLVMCAAASASMAQTPQAVPSRAAAIRAVVQEVQDECQRYAGGRWEQWYTQLAAFRADLKARIAAAQQRLETFKTNPAAPNGLLEVDLNPRMYEWPVNAEYVAPDNAASWAGSRPAAHAIVEVSQWLAARNIDLVVVPAPRIAEVYGDRIATGAPADHFLAPHMRRFVMDLANAGVEVVDLLPIFLTERDRDPEALYLVADGHWSDRAQRLAAREIAARLRRYAAVRTAAAQKKRFLLTPATIPLAGSLLTYLTPSEQAQVRAVAGTIPVTKVTTTSGEPFEEPLDSPVVVIGDSFTHYFQLALAKGTGIDALLSSEINVPVSNVSSAGATVDPIKDFLRRPELLAGRKVVVWIENDMALGYDGGWDVPPLPKSGRGAGGR